MNSGNDKFISEVFLSLEQKKCKYIDVNALENNCPGIQEINSPYVYKIRLNILFKAFIWYLDDLHLNITHIWDYSLGISVWN